MRQWIPDIILKKQDKGMTLDSETSTPDPPNPDQVIDSDDETETTEKFL